MIIDPTETNDDDQNLPSGPSHLFLLRLWVQAEHEAGDQTDWLGRLQDPLTGETCAFRGWAGLRETILRMAAYRQFLGG